MTTRAAFWKGIRLHQDAQGMLPNPASVSGERDGVTRLFAKSVSGSPNWKVAIDVYTSVPEVTAYSDLNKQTTLMLRFQQQLSALIAASKAEGDLSWCQDDTQTADVTGSFSGSAATVTHDTPGGSWTPTTNQLVLFRNPTTGAGFVTTIDGTGSGSVTVDLDEAITTAWDMVYVQSCYPTTRFVTHSPGAPQNGAGDYSRTGNAVTYSFLSTADVEISSLHTQDLG